MPIIGSMNDIKPLHIIEANRIIDSMGGTTSVAKLFGIRPASVSDWRKDGVPDARLFSIRLLRPDLFKDQSKVSA